MTQLIVKTKLRDLVQERGFKVSGDLYVAMSDKIIDILNQGIERAEANGRKTILVRDI